MLPLLRVNRYTGQQSVVVEPHFKVMPLLNWSVSWSRSELFFFLQKLLVYKRDFRKMRAFLPFKSVKHMVDLWYAIKKKLNLAVWERLI